MSEARLHILAMEAYDGGSHGAFLDGLIASSGHRFTRWGLPPRKWKWRMRGAGIYFAQELQRRSNEIGGPENTDLIFTSDMTSVADLRALLPGDWQNKPIVCYFHENQLTYPLPDESQRDYQYGFTNITTCLAADAIWFNSCYHLRTFLEAARKLLAKMPDYVPEGLPEEIERRAVVRSLGLPDEVFAAYKPGTANRENAVPIILWNHRWEYDKNPDDFFEALLDLDRQGVNFRLIVAGEQFRDSPPIFGAIEKSLAHRLEHFGYVADRAEYLALLSRADIVVSTAIHEFFGLSILEATARGCYPLLPRRLSYPELMPSEASAVHFYDDGRDLRAKLAWLCENWPQAAACDLAQHVRSYSWGQLAGEYDQAFVDAVARGRGNGLR
ncbi:MAG: DUF3524 domain-containing protein [Sedimentisphaerales bacterium]|nr:DUF3524 domain-containing protein [Sedimentisphaerales bacterium]